MGACLLCTRAGLSMVWNASRARVWHQTSVGRVRCRYALVGAARIGRRSRRHGWVSSRGGVTSTARVLFRGGREIRV